MNALDLTEATGRRTLAVGSVGPEFENLLGVDGKRHGFGEYSDRRALVIVFSSNRCPTAKAYASRMNALAAEYGPRGVQLIAINSNDPHLYPDENYERMIRRAAEDGYEFPYLADVDQRVAGAYGAQCTFHVFLLDEDRRLRYEGRFDDARLENRVTSHDLVNALEAVLAGREVAVPRTRPFGCSLDFVSQPDPQ